MIFDFNQLSCFVAVAEELHFGRAATRLFMTQPPLSRQIQLLEHAVGAKLFERTSRSVRLTTAGQVFLVDATRLLYLAEQAANSARRASKGETGRVTIGFTAAAGYEMVPKLLAAAKQALPDIDVVLKELISAAQVEALEANTIDLGFLRPLFSRQRIELLLIEREPLVVALPADHELAKRDRIQLMDMNGQPFIMHSPKEGKYFHDLIIGLFGSSGVAPDYIQYLDQTHTILALVRAGLGIGILPASAQRFHFDSVAFRPLWREDVVAEMCLAWRSDHGNPAVSRFRKFAAAYFSTGPHGMASKSAS